jgi:hypothetical protein
MTLHTAFKFKVGKKYERLSENTLNTLQMLLSAMKLLIIDEVSMIRNDMLYDTNKRLKEIFDPTLDFGGIPVLVFGHFRQLPPIPPYRVFTPPRHFDTGELVGNYLWQKFEFYELDEIMRQRGEWDFCKALNNMAEGEMDEEDISLIKSREISDTLPAPENAIWLFWRNIDCDKKNEEIHRSLNSESAISRAIDRVQGKPL